MNKYGLTTPAALTAIVAVVAMTVLVSGNPVHRPADENLWVVMTGLVKLDKPTSMKLCGDKLAEVLSLVCHGHYNKRTSNHNNFLADSHQSASELIQVPSEELLSLTESVLRRVIDMSPERFNRRVRSAPHHCCQNSCSMTTLRSYCRESSATNMPNMTPDSASE